MCCGIEISEKTPFKAPKTCYFYRKKTHIHSDNGDMWVSLFLFVSFVSICLNMLMLEMERGIQTERNRQKLKMIKNMN